MLLDVVPLIVTIPLALRLVILAVAGAAVGSLLNLAIYRLAYHARLISPWSRTHPDATPARWYDRLPILGWFALRRHAPLHGPWFWVRPMLIELGTAVGAAWLYWWEVEQAGVVGGPAAKALIGDTSLHALYLAHVVWLALLVVATFIDFDEQMIPDEVTVPGTVVALVLAALVPAARLPVVELESGRRVVGSLWITTPLPWPAWLDGRDGLLCAIACLLAWCVALLPKLWVRRRGLAAALRLFVAHIVRPPRKNQRPDVAPRRPYPTVIALLVVGAIGPFAIAGVWAAGGAGWQSLLTALVGMAFGGGLIWAVRIIGSQALGKEAMGFGDVTLMAMIGAFSGWQAALIVFFLAPFAALVIAVLQWMFTGRHDIAFGPYLSLASLLLIICWPAVWRRAEPIFAMGWFVVWLLVACLALMALMLLGMRLLRQMAEP